MRDDGIFGDIFGDIFFGVVGAHLFLVDIFFENIAENVRVNLIVAGGLAVVQMPLPLVNTRVVVLEPTIFKYADPSFVVCQVSVVSFQRNCTAGSSPRITRIPALLTGTPVVSALISIMLSSTVNDATLKLPPPPLIVKLPDIVTSSLS